MKIIANIFIDAYPVRWKLYPARFPEMNPGISRIILYRTGFGRQ